MRIVKVIGHYNDWRHDVWFENPKSVWSMTKDHDHREIWKFTRIGNILEIEAPKIKYGNPCLREDSTQYLLKGNGSFFIDREGHNCYRFYSKRIQLW